jgi:hypothetical protein
MEVGLGRTCNCAVGLAAMKGPSHVRRIPADRSHQRAKALYRIVPSACLVSALAAILSACSAISTVSGVVAGVATGSASGNPALGVSAAIVVKAGVDEAGKYVSRNAQHDEQKAIAAAAGETRVGESRPWQIRHRLTRRVEQGEVRVTRVIDTPLTVCKELLFSVAQYRNNEASPAWFRTNACRHGNEWKWAAAEPAVNRWGNLQ